MPFRRRRREMQPIASINLTSLLDVTFVLLLTFMIVAPTLKTGIEIDLPKVEESAPLTVRKTATITLKNFEQPGGPVRIYLNNKAVNRDELRRGLEELLARHGARLDVVIEADRLVPCEEMLRALAVTKDVGIESVGVVTEPAKKKK